MIVWFLHLIFTLVTHLFVTWQLVKCRSVSVTHIVSRCWRCHSMTSCLNIVNTSRSYKRYTLSLHTPLRYVRAVVCSLCSKLDFTFSAISASFATRLQWAYSILHRNSNIAIKPLLKFCHQCLDFLANNKFDEMTAITATKLVATIIAR